MKKMSKRLLSLLLITVLVLTTLPLTAISVFADNTTDNLDAAIATFDSYITGLHDDGIDALYTNMGEAYEVYREAVQLRTHGSDIEMRDVTNRLNTAMSKMEKFDQAKIDAAYEANHPVKIGEGANQPLKGSQKTAAMGYTDDDKTINDYDNVIYSDGDTASWDQALETFFDFTYGYLVTERYQNRVRVYYPNSVILYDGETVPKVPIISAFQGLYKYSWTDGHCTVVMENMYESTNDVELLYNFWFGTTCGYPWDTGSGNNGTYPNLYENPEWPSTESSRMHSDDKYYYISSDPANLNVNDPDDGSPEHLTDCTTKYQIFKNSLQYIPTVSETRNFDAGYQEVKNTKWSGTGRIYWGALGLTWKNTCGMQSSVQDGTAIYVVNYKYYLDNLKSSLTRFHDDLTVDNARNGYLGSILSALSVAAAFNPLDEEKYPYSDTSFEYTDKKGNEATGMEAATRKCGDDIDAVVDTLGSADIDDVDAQYENLVAALNAYEEKMAKQTVYTEMADAYETYCLGRKYADSYQYGKRDEFTPSLQTIAYNLDKQTKAMRAVGKNAYNYYPGQGFDGDLDSETKTDAYKAAYKNLVYASSAPTRTREAGFPSTTFAPADSFTRKTNNASKTDGVLGLYRYCNTGTLTATGYDTGSSTFLYVPNAVGVYDGVSGDINVPVLLGFRAAGGWTGLFTNPYHYTLWSYSSDTSGLPFAYNYWKTRKYTAGDAATYDNNDKDSMGSRTNAYSARGMTFIESANLNQILNGSTIDASPNAISTNKDTAISTLYNNGYYSNTRSDNKAETPNPENFYANAITLTKPNFTGADWKKYMYEYTTITTTMRSNSTRGDSASVSTSTSASADTSYGSYSNTIDTLSLWVIDYSGVQAIINKNDDILTDSALDIKKYSEGNLLDYFKDMDKLTACSPVNAKYEYDNAKYKNTVPGSTLTGYDAATEQCAYDIWRLLEAGEEDEKVQYLDENGMKVDDEYIDIKEDLKNDVNYVDGTYDDLRAALDLDPTSEVGPCIGNEGDIDYYAAYEAAVAEGRQEMYNVSNYNAVDGSYEGYVVDADDTTIEDTANKIIEKYNDLLAHNKQTRHGYVYSGKENDKFENFTVVNYFNCGLVPAHDEHLSDGDVPYNYAEMEMYENLAIAYSTLDPAKYNNPKILYDGKEEFDKAVAQGDELTVDELKDRQGMKAQDIVDGCTQALLEAINIENGVMEGDDGLTTDKRVTHYSIKFNVVNTETGDITDLTSSLVDTESESIIVEQDGTIKVPFGYEFVADPVQITGGADCTGWEVKAGTGDAKRLAITTNKLPYYVLDNAEITAYYTPKAAEEEKTVTIGSIYGYELYKVNVPANATLKIKKTDLNTVIVNDGENDTEYEVPNGLQQNITGWRFNGNEYYPDFESEGENLLNITITADMFIKPIAPVIPVNGPYVITLDGTPIETTDEEPEGKSFVYDEIVTVKSNVENCYAIAVKSEGKYIPVAYGDTYKFYANSQMTAFYSLVRSVNQTEEGGDQISTDGIPLYSYSVGGVDVTNDYSEEQIFMMKGNMPMVNSISELTDSATNKFTARSQYTLNIGSDLFNNGLTVKEVGTIYYVDKAGTYDNHAETVEAMLKLDNVGNSSFMVNKKISTVTDYNANRNFSNQYSFSLTNAHNRHCYARAYVKYEYKFADPNDPSQSATISAVYYGNVVNMFVAD